MTNKVPVASRSFITKVQASVENFVECNNKQNNENGTQLETMSSKEHAGKDVIESTEYNQKPVDAAEDVNDVSDYKQTEEVLMDRCGSTGVKNGKLITSETAEGLCDLNFPVNNGGLCDTDGQHDSEPFQDGTNELTSMDFMTSEKSTPQVANFALKKCASLMDAIKDEGMTKEKQNLPSDQGSLRLLFKF
ncbi:zinc finger, PHD-type [Artemisia annua]|uniref:Zinc finger, PHD-type n=1 Tax=Artemisia annua TaxID=35608 RepID=A0A2U1NF20_ARTAN|nr:zinc finger, PHD-type [Artemisia annua]